MMLDNVYDTLIRFDLFFRFSASWLRSMCRPLADLADVAYAFKFLNVDDTVVARVAR